MKKIFFIFVVVSSCDFYYPTPQYDISGKIVVDDTVYIGINEGKITYKLYKDGNPYEGNLLLDALQEGPPGPIRYDTLFSIYKSGEGTLSFSFEVDTYALEVTFELKEVTRGISLDVKTSYVRR